MPWCPSWLAAVDKEQPVAVAGKARPNAMLATKLSERSVQFPCVAAHDLGSAMGEDGAADICLLAPDKLGDDRSVANQRPVSLAHHRAAQGRAVADINIGPS